MLNASQGLPLVFPQGQPSTGGGRSRPHDDEDLHYEPTDEEEEKQKKKQEMPKSPRLSSSARRRKRRRRTKQSEGPSEPQEPVDAEDQHSFEEPVMGGDGVDDGRESPLDDVPVSQRKTFQEGEATSSNKAARHDSLEDVGMQSLMMEKGHRKVTIGFGLFWQTDWKTAMSKALNTRSTIPIVFVMNCLIGWSEKQKKAMQQAAEKEIATWMKLMQWK